ncbi:hypothetical protein M0Q50_07860 [bacterium]|jgi:hypothetical protein|nr:hypothetical protein [bacterium]
MIIQKIRDFLYHNSDNEYQKKYKSYEKIGWDPALDDDKLMSREQYDIIRKNDLRNKKLKSL